MRGIRYVTFKWDSNRIKVSSMVQHKQYIGKMTGYDDSLTLQDKSTIWLGHSIFYYGKSLIQYGRSNNQVICSHSQHSFGDG